MNVQNILDGKGRSDVVTAKSHDTIDTLVQRLTRERIGAVVVSDRDGEIDGIISERDVVRGLSEHGLELLHMPVSGLMSREVAACTRTDSVKAVMRMMSGKRIRHLPVVDEGELVGVISIRDVVKSQFDEIERENNVLLDFVGVRGSVGKI